MVQQAQQVAELVKLLKEGAKSDWGREISAQDLQELTECVIQIFAARTREMEEALAPVDEWFPIPGKSRITDTDALLFVHKLLLGKNLELFEVQMFRNFC